MTTEHAPQAGIRIAPDSTDAADVRQLLHEHMADMLATSPPESMHALSADELAHPGISFWTARDTSGALLGTGAVKDLGDGTGEIKSMRTVGAARGRGIGAAMLERILDEARGRGWSALYLETGTQEEFAAARRLYVRYGFRETGPFGSYGIDPNSTYFVLELAH